MSLPPHKLPLDVKKYNKVKKEIHDAQYPEMPFEYAYNKNKNWTSLVEEAYNKGRKDYLLFCLKQEYVPTNEFKLFLAMRRVIFAREYDSRIYKCTDIETEWDYELKALLLNQWTDEYMFLSTEYVHWITNEPIPTVKMIPNFKGLFCYECLKKGSKLKDLGFIAYYS